MTETRSGQTTGADLDQEIRRRNLPAQGGSNGTIFKLPEADDKKKAQKVRPEVRCVTTCSHEYTKPRSSIISTLDEYEFLIAPLIFTALAFFTRMWKIGLSPIVTWDEAQYVNSLKTTCPTSKQNLR